MSGGSVDSPAAAVRALRRKLNRLRPARYKFQRRFVQRCEACAHHARWNESWHSYGNRDGKVWHGPCMAAEWWRATSAERLTVVALMAEISGLVSRDVQSVAALREAEWSGRGRYEDLVWRTFHALEQRRDEKLDV